MHIAESPFLALKYKLLYQFWKFSVFTDYTDLSLFSLNTRMELDQCERPKKTQLDKLTATLRKMSFN